MGARDPIVLERRCPVQIAIYLFNLLFIFYLIRVYFSELVCALLRRIPIFADETSVSEKALSSV